MKAFWQQCEGQIIDGFPLQQYLGGGEDHAVFLTERGSDQPHRAAIKLILADPDTTENQLRRWRLASELANPNLLGLYERGYWQLNETPLLYVVMEYADESLSQVIPERPLTAGEAREMLDPALRALTYLHASGFVHGRLKPSNFMAVGNQLKLSSDGLSQAGAEGMTPADDVWSLGATLVEALTQHRPVWNENAANEPELPASLLAEFREIARNTLRRDPGKRWTMAQIQERLGARTAGTRKQIYAAAAGVAIILLAMAAGVRFIHKQAPAPVSQAQQPAIATPPPKPQAKPSPMPPAPHQPETKPAPTLSTQGDVIQQVLPDVLPRARNSIHGKVAVDVLVEVDQSGSVENAALASRGPSRYFAGLALKAAQRWKFAPADGPRTWMLRFQFTRAGTKVAHVRVNRESR